MKTSTMHLEMHSVLHFMMKKYKKQAEDTLEKFRQKCPDASFAIGECLNADPFELSLALIRYGFSVPEIYGTITVENFTYIRSLAKNKSRDESIFQYGTDDDLL